MRNTKKNGVLYLEDTLEKEWRPHFFVLSGNKLYYTDLCKTDMDNDDEMDGGDLDNFDISSSNRLREVSYIFVFLILYSINKVKYWKMCIFGKVQEPNGHFTSH